jgi:hypothetical protein
MQLCNAHAQELPYCTSLCARVALPAVVAVLTRSMLSLTHIGTQNRAGNAEPLARICCSCIHQHNQSGMRFKIFLAASIVSHMYFKSCSSMNRHCLPGCHAHPQLLTSASLAVASSSTAGFTMRMEFITWLSFDLSSCAMSRKKPCRCKPECQSQGP